MKVIQSRLVGRRSDNRALALALILPLLRVSRVLGQAEDEAGYRRSYYQEDNNRINVTTDTVQFDVGILSNVRLIGSGVLDAISGATPTGAPPQSKWPYPTFNNYYQTSYQQAYNSLYNTFYDQNLIYVGLPGSPIPTLQALTNQSVAYAQSTAPAIATNSASASYSGLTNNPNYHKNSVPLTRMHDRRTAFSLQAPITLRQSKSSDVTHTITPAIAYSQESDYVSYSASLSDAMAFNNKNTTASFGENHNQDKVRDDNFLYEAKVTDDIFIGLVQLCGPKAYFTVNTSISFERGYLSDPYRGVITSEQLQTNPDDAALIPENRPHHRNKALGYASWTQFLTPLNGSYVLSYRFFQDTYGVSASTLEAQWNQKVGKHLVVSLLFRYYNQSAADFYYTIVPEKNGKLPTFYSSDYRLSELETFATGVTITWRVIKHLSLDASYLRYQMVGLDGVTSQSAYPSANMVSFGARVWF